MVDWLMVSNLATGAGTLVLAVATFGSVRSANRAVRIAEHALLQNMRPVLVPSRTEDRTEPVTWGDRHCVQLAGGQAIADVVDDNVYLAISLRNVGNGIGVLQGWYLNPDRRDSSQPHQPVEDFRPQRRDLYVPANDLSFWQAGLRDASDEWYRRARDRIEQRTSFSLDLHYSDHEGRQHAVSRFALFPSASGGWFTAVIRHWNLDHDDPRRDDPPAA